MDIHSVNMFYFNIDILIDEASGSSMDWTKFRGVRWTYAPELRPATAVEGGFIIPAVPNIRESGAEIFAAFARLKWRNKPQATP